MDEGTFAYIRKRQQQQPDLSHVGAVPPPPGITPNFDNPEYATSPSAGPWLVGVGITISGLFILMRIYTKRFILHNFGGEDAAIVMAFICVCATSATGLKGQSYGTGRHIWDIPINQFVPKWGQYITATTVLYCPSMMFAKLAILLCYLRISPQKVFRAVVWVTIGLVLSYNIAIMLALVFGCTPIAKTWDVRIMTGHCISRPGVYMSNAVLNVVTDFIILLMPLPMIYRLQVSTRQKLLVAGMFSVGSLACIVSVIRLKLQADILNDPDQTWAVALPGIWVIVEINLAVVCGCLSVIRPFLRHHLPFLVGESRKSASSKRYNKKVSDYFSSSGKSGGMNSKNRTGVGKDADLMTWEHPERRMYGDDIPLGGGMTRTEDGAEPPVMVPATESQAFSPNAPLAASTKLGDEEMGRPDSGAIGKGESGAAGTGLFSVVSPPKKAMLPGTVGRPTPKQDAEQAWVPDIPSKGSPRQTGGAGGILRTTEVDVSNMNR